MIDVRTHVVSLVAVFLALAVGLAVGASFLDDRLLSDIQGRVDTLVQDKRRLEAQVAALDARQENAQGFARALQPLLVDGRLAGRTVLLVSTGAAPEEAGERASRVLREAGAEVSGTVELTDSYGLDGEAGRAAEAVVALEAAGEAPGPPLPVDDEGVASAGPQETWDRTASLLAASLVDPGVALGAQEPPDTLLLPSGVEPRTLGLASAQRLLSSLRDAGLLDDSADVGAAASVIVVLGDDPPLEGEPDPEAAALAGQRRAAALELVRQLEVRGVTLVVAGSPRGLVADVRADGLADEVSTVAPLRGPQDETALVLALVAQQAGEVDAYGVGAQTALPEVPGLTDGDVRGTGSSVRPRSARPAGPVRPEGVVPPRAAP